MAGDVSSRVRADEGSQCDPTGIRCMEGLGGLLFPELPGFMVGLVKAKGALKCMELAVL